MLAESCAASSSARANPLEEFFSKLQVGWGRDMDAYVKDKLLNPQISEKFKDGWRTSVYELFTDINRLLTEENLKGLTINIFEAKDKKDIFTFLVDLEDLNSATIFLEPSAQKLISAPTQMPEGDRWHLGALPFHPEVIIYHEFIHLLYWLHKKKEEKAGGEEIYRIFDNRNWRNRDRFWRLGSYEDFGRMWGILEEQIVTIGMPKQIPGREGPIDYTGPLGKFSEKQIRQLIGLPPRYPYIAPIINGGINMEVTESSANIRRVFHDWIGDEDNFEGANYEGWEPFEV